MFNPYTTFSPKLLKWFPGPDYPVLQATSSQKACSLSHNSERECLRGQAWGREEEGQCGGGGAWTHWASWVTYNLNHTSAAQFEADCLPPLSFAAPLGISLAAPPGCSRSPEIASGVQDELVLLGSALCAPITRFWCNENFSYINKIGIWMLSSSHSENKFKRLFKFTLIIIQFSLNFNIFCK